VIDLWLDSGSAGIVVLPFILCYAVAAAIVWLTHLSPARPFFASCIGIVGPFFASVALLFGLFAAFLANEVSQQNERARDAVAREADGVRTILRMSEAVGDAAGPLRTAAVAYANDVLAEEWPAMRRGVMPEQAMPAQRQLALAMMAPDLGRAAPAPAHQAMVAAFVEIRQARMDRAALVARHGASINWLGMIVLGVLTQVAVGVVQLDRLRPQALALFVFTTAFAATVGLIGLHERPFSGTAISDAPLRIAISTATP
jgi:hypothetical protein